jgi:hypothetical protein
MRVKATQASRMYGFSFAKVRAGRCVVHGQKKPNVYRYGDLYTFRSV